MMVGGEVECDERRRKINEKREMEGSGMDECKADEKMERIRGVKE